MRGTLALAALTLLAGAAACGTPEPRLAPAPDLERTPGPGVGSAVRRARITVEARARAWAAEPADLHTRVTPLLVGISNESTRPLRIRYDAFALVTARGPSLAAIPPYDVGDSATRPVAVVGRPARGFAVAPYLARYYPDLPTANASFPFDSVHYRTYAPRLRDGELPTWQMVQQALPEGVLAPGGSVRGFVYFEDAGPLFARARFRMDFVDAATGIQFDTAVIPFVDAEHD